MNRLVLIGVDLVDGKPDLQLPASAEIMKHDDNHFVVEWGSYHLTAYKLGTVGGTLYFLGTGDPAILVGLSHLGAAVKLAKNLNTTVRDQILATGIRAIRRVSDNAIVGIAPPVVFAGDDPLTVGLDGEFDPGEEYFVEEPPPP
jgi:hypothetical protein